MSYFAEHKDIKELTRAVAVELIQSIKVTDKNNIEVVFSFNDSFYACADMVKTQAVGGTNIYVMPERMGAVNEFKERQVI